MLLNFFAKADFLRAAVFLCSTPLVTLLSIRELTSIRFSLAASTFSGDNEVSKRLMLVFSLLFWALFLRRLSSAIRALFAGVLLFATFSPPWICRANRNTIALCILNCNDYIEKKEDGCLLPFAAFLIWILDITSLGLSCKMHHLIYFL